MKEDTSASGNTGDAQECLTPHLSSGDVTPSDHGSRVPRAERPQQDIGSVQHNDMSSRAVHSTIGVLGLHAQLWHLVSPAHMAHN